MIIDELHRTVRSRFWAALGRGETKRCPTCKRTAKVYHRTINSGQARSLITMYNIAGDDWVHLPTQLSARSREEGKLRYWGLVEEQQTVREDGGRAGYWRLTPLGVKFVRNRVKVPSHVWVYNAECVGVDREHEISIIDALGNDFNYFELIHDSKRMEIV